MKLSTPISLQSPDSLYTYGSNFLNLGSCFASNLANKLDYFGFTSLQNPIGVLFHPFAINQFCKWLDNESIDEKLFVKDQGIWKSMQAHSCMQGETSEELLHVLQDAVESTRNYLAKTDAVFITFGTAFSYQHLFSSKYVANCQKQNASLFDKKLIGIQALIEAINEIIQILSKHTKAKIYFSLSPVRHLKDGLVENNLSKAHLLAAMHQVVEQHKQVSYLPAYEIVLDELRDYRFYDRDLLHPNQLAIDFVWEKFSVAYFDELTKQVMKKVDKFKRLSAHRPMQKNKALHLAHFAKLESHKEELLALEPKLKLD
jgi:hypothetical protein